MKRRKENKDTELEVVEVLNESTLSSPSPPLHYPVICTVKKKSLNRRIFLYLVCFMECVLHSFWLIFTLLILPPRINNRHCWAAGEWIQKCSEVPLQINLVKKKNINFHVLLNLSALFMYTCNKCPFRNIFCTARLKPKYVDLLITFKNLL